jgi:8-oxo-dGTP diphosphatase
MSTSLTIEVTAGLIQDGEGRYLITQRRRGSHLEGLWEFPGGKLEPQESVEACLRRELAEEVSALFTIGEKIDTIRWAYPDRTVIIHFYRCELESGTIRPLEAQPMAWVDVERLSDYEFPPADRAIIERLRSMPPPRTLRSS